MQSLLRQRKRLKQENEELRTQIRTDEASFPGNTEFSSGSFTRWSEKEVLLACQTRADKYSMLEDNVRVATQQVLVTNRPTKDYEA
ncbi:hypothetical protein AAG906_026605 [Vitis piasezkii]